MLKKILQAISLLLFVVSSICFASVMLIAPLVHASKSGMSSSGRSADEKSAVGEDEKEDELTLRGKAMRRAIDARYESLDQNRKLKSLGNGFNDITDVVTEFIPIGSSFDNAEKILAAAGFEIGPRKQFRYSKETFAVLAQVDVYRSVLFGKTSLLVQIEPKSRDDWRTVATIDAQIFIVVV